MKNSQSKRFIGVNSNHRLRGSVLFTVRKVARQKVQRYTNDAIELSVGYSGDSEQVTIQHCYNLTESSISAPKIGLKLGTAISFSELEDELGVFVSRSGKYGMFSTAATESYLRSLQDNDYALSLNYYQYSMSDVTLNAEGYGDKALTKSGESLYNDGKNGFFGLVCGDYYLTSYQKGALLTMGLNIRLTSSYVKEKFNEKAGTAFGHIAHVAENIQFVCAKYNITGSIIVQVFQIGGDPDQLSKIFGRNRNGNSFALRCSLSAMDNCVTAARDLLDYVIENFPNQFSFYDNTGLTPLDPDFSRYESIKSLGLTPPVSLVTPQVLQYRHELSRILRENENYQQQLYPFFNGDYAVKLNDTFMERARSILSKADSNVLMIMQPHNGAADCFDYPQMCKSIKAMIDSQLENITISDFKFLDHISSMIPVKSTGRIIELILLKGDESENAVGISPELRDITPDLIYY